MSGRVRGQKIPFRPGFGEKPFGGEAAEGMPRNGVRLMENVLQAPFRAAPGDLPGADQFEDRLKCSFISLQIQ
ncbi:hypothetical protein MASR1M66_23230 [Aminivibrio sp.]